MLNTKLIIFYNFHRIRNSFKILQLLGTAGGSIQFVSMGSFKRGEKDVAHRYDLETGSKIRIALM